MPSFQDSAVLVILALLLFGPKGMVKLGRELGKLLAEFRRASNDFRIQMDDEFRADEQAEQQRKIAAMTAAAPVSPAATPVALAAAAEDSTIQDEAAPAGTLVTAPLPIASSGSLHLMPPATGLPLERSPLPVDVATSLNGAFDAIPHTPDPQLPAAHTHEEFLAPHPHDEPPPPPPDQSGAPLELEPDLLHEAARHG